MMRLLKLIFGMSKMEQDINDLKAYREQCEKNHESAGAHRRKSDAEMTGIKKTLDESLETNKEILKVLKEYAPTVKRVKDDHTTRDKIKEAATWIAAVAAGGAGLHYWVNMLS